MTAATAKARRPAISGRWIWDTWMPVDADDSARSPSKACDHQLLLSRLFPTSLARRACSHYLSPSTISPKLMKAMNITSSLSNREKMRRKPLSLRNSRSTSFRRLFISRSYSHGSRRLLFGGTTGMKPRSSASCRVWLPSYALSISKYSGRFGGPRLCSKARPSGASSAWPAESENLMAVRASEATI